ncbi:MAG: hypothetical protein P4L53_23345 [Candidatus Obscuribacterales bacterium]|nr:hypothetical protein [Candidatus Obscuribacterales bacterium]
MRQRQVERTRRRQVRQFFSGVERLCDEFGQFEEGKPLVADLFMLREHVEQIVASGDALISFAKTLPDTSNRSQAVAECIDMPEAESVRDSRFKYVQHMKDLPLFVLSFRMNGLKAFVDLRQKVRDGAAQVSEQDLAEFYWLVISLDHQVQALKAEAISIATLYEAQMRQLKIRLWMGQMGAHIVSRYEGDDQSGARFAF